MRSVLWEEVEVDCLAFGMSAEMRQCLMGTDECGVTEFDLKCGFMDITATCATDSDCPSPLLCDEAIQECAECASDADCATVDECRGGVCLAP